MRKSVLLSSNTKQRLDVLKRGLSFDAYLSKVADFFENSGASLDDGKLPINQLLKDQANRIIEVMRGIEKKQNTLFKSLAERIEQSSLSTPSTEIERFLDMDDLAQVQQVIDRNSELERKMKDLQAEVKALKAQKEFLEKQPVPSLSGIDEEQLLQLVDKMRGTFKPSPIEKDKFFISKSEANAILSRIEEIVRM